MPTPGYVNNTVNLAGLQATKANLVLLLAQETAFQVGHGPKESYSLDGESHQWTEWREAMVRKIDKLNTLIQQEAGPYCTVSRVTGGGW